MNLDEFVGNGCFRTTRCAELGIQSRRQLRVPTTAAAIAAASRSTTRGYNNTPTQHRRSRRLTGLTVQNLRQPMLDVPMDVILLGLVQDFVPSAGVEPVLKRQLTLPHVAGDEILDRVPPRLIGLPLDERRGSDGSSEQPLPAMACSGRPRCKTTKLPTTTSKEPASNGSLCMSAWRKSISGCSRRARAIIAPATSTPTTDAPRSAARAAT